MINQTSAVGAGSSRVLAQGSETIDAVVFYDNKIPDLTMLDRAPDPGTEKRPFMNSNQENLCKLE